MRTIYLLLIAFTAPLHAQSGGPYTLDWSTVDTGGASSASAGGAYTVRGTIGQADAGAKLAGGSYQLAGGFWCVQTLGAPFLKLKFNAATNEAVLSWDVTNTDWQLELSTDLINWLPAPVSVVKTPTHHTVTLPKLQRCFFRLRK